MSTSEPPPVPPGAPPPPPPPSTPATSTIWRAQRWPAQAVFVALTVVAAAVVYAIVTLAEERSLVGDSGIESRADFLRLVELDDRVGTLNDVFLALILITACAFVTWMFRAAKNSEALGRTSPRFAPGWSIGGWLIPIANFVIPVLIMQDLWRGSDASAGRDDHTWKIGNRSLLVGFWWGCLLFGRLLIAIGGSNVESGSLDEIQSGIDLQIGGNLLSLSAAVLGVLVVRAITQRQDECLRTQQAQWTAPPPPPAP